MNKERQVRYNYRRSKSNLECLEWWFLIINQNREIEEVKQRVYSLFAPIEEESPSVRGVVTKTGLRYELLNFESKKRVRKEELRRLYRRVILDTKLYNRKDPDGLANFLAEQLEG